MRINVYAEELPDDDFEGVGLPPVERVEVIADTGRKFFGARLYLKSHPALHQDPADDDRGAVTVWGPRERVAGLLRRMADEMERERLERRAEDAAVARESSRALRGFD